VGGVCDDHSFISGYRLCVTAIRAVAAGRDKNFQPRWQLVEALNEVDVLVRRTAARRLAQAPSTPSRILARTLDNDDVLVRRTGLAEIFRRGGNGVLDAAEGRRVFVRMEDPAQTSVTLHNIADVSVSNLCRNFWQHTAQAQRDTDL